MRTFLVGLVVSRYFLGIMLFVAAFGAVRLFPDAKLFGMTTGETAMVFIIVATVIIIVHGRSETQPNETGQD